MSFWRFFVVRLGWALIGLWLAVTIVFVITRVAVSPAVACRAFFDRESVVDAVTCQREVVQELNLDDPIHERYLQFVWRLVAHQSPGSELFGGGDAGKLARHALPDTAALVSGALVLALALAAAAGIGWSRVNVRWDRVVRFSIYLVVGLAPIFLGLVLSYLVGFKLSLTPLAGSCNLFTPAADPGCGGARDWLAHLVLPVVTLSLFFAAIYTRIVRAGVADIRAMRGREEREELRRRLILVLARVAGRDFGWAIGVAFLVESTFSIPGLARTVHPSAEWTDPVILEAALLYAVVLAIAVHFLVDVVVGALDSDLRAEWPVAGMPKPPQVLK